MDGVDGARDAALTPAQDETGSARPRAHLEYKYHLVTAGATTGRPNREGENAGRVLEFITGTLPPTLIFATFPKPRPRPRVVEAAFEVAAVAEADDGPESKKAVARDGMETIRTAAVASRKARDVMCPTAGAWTSTTGLSGVDEGRRPRLRTLLDPEPRLVVGIHVQWPPLPPDWGCRRFQVDAIME